MMSNKEYSRLLKEKSPKSPVLKDCIFAFLIGGFICTLGEAFTSLYTYLKISEDDAKTLTSVTLVFIGVLLTVFGLYDRIAKYAGAGTLVPFTGFANSVSSPAIEFKFEGFVLGVGANMFTIAGPVIVYGVTASVVYGLIYYLFSYLPK